MENKYTASLIGCGRIGYSLGLDKKREQPASHTMAMLDNNRILLIAGVDTDSTTLQKWHDANKKCIVYSSSANLYARQHSDIIVIAVNEKSHLKETLDAIQAKPKLIILEKPVALNSIEAKLIKDSATRDNIPIIVNHERRFADDYNKAKSLMDKIGTITSIRGSLHSGMKVYSPREELTGFYSLLHDGTHLIDIILFLLEDNAGDSGSILSLSAVTGIKKDEKGEVRNLNAHFSCSKCSDVSIQINGESKFFGFEVDIIGTEGRILIGNGIFKLFVKEESKLYSNFYSLEEDKSVKGPKHSGYFSNMYKNAVEFLDGKAELKSTLQTGMNTLAIIDRIKERLH